MIPLTLLSMKPKKRQLLLPLPPSSSSENCFNNFRKCRWSRREHPQSHPHNTAAKILLTRRHYLVCGPTCHRQIISPLSPSSPMCHSLFSRRTLLVSRSPHVPPAPSDYGQPSNPSLHAPLLFDLLQQPYFCGPRIIQIHSRSSFEVDESSTQSKSTNLPMSLKNSVTSVPNFPSNYITDSAAFSAQFSTHGNKKHGGKPIPICEYCKKQ